MYNNPVQIPNPIIGNICQSSHPSNIENARKEIKEKEVFVYNFLLFKSDNARTAIKGRANNNEVIPVEID